MQTAIRKISYAAAGDHESANQIYAANKETVKGILDAHNVSPKAFDAHMKDYTHAAGVRAPRVKLSNMFRT